jgi:hypothetical protein
MTAKMNGGSSKSMNEAAKVQALSVGRRRRSLRMLDDHKITSGTTTTAVLEEKSEYVSLRNRTVSTTSSSSSDFEETEAESSVVMGSYNNWLIGSFISADISTLTGVCREAASRVASLFQFPSVDQILFSGFAVDDEHDDFYSSSSRQHDRERLRLPWEVRCAGEETYQEDHELKEKIHGLSFDDDNFLKPFKVAQLSACEVELNIEQCAGGGHKYYNAPGTFCFVLDGPHTQLAYQIMQVDPQLQATREKLLNVMPTTTTASAATKEANSNVCSGKCIIQSGDARETAFWKNYFYHCNETRISHLAMYDDSRDDTHHHMPTSAAATCSVGSSWWLPSSSSTGCPGLALLTSPAADENEEEDFKAFFQPAFPGQMVQYHEIE